MLVAPNLIAPLIYVGHIACGGLAAGRSIGRPLTIHNIRLAIPARWNLEAIKGSKIKLRDETSQDNHQVNEQQAIQGAALGQTGRQDSVKNRANG